MGGPATPEGTTSGLGLAGGIGGPSPRRWANRLALCQEEAAPAEFPDRTRPRLRVGSRDSQTEPRRPWERPGANGAREPRSRKTLQQANPRVSLSEAKRRSP